MDQGFPVVIVVDHRGVALGVFFSLMELFHLLCYISVKIHRTIRKKTILLKLFKKCLDCILLKYSEMAGLGLGFMLLQFFTALTCSYFFEISCSINMNYLSFPNHMQFFLVFISLPILWPYFHLLYFYPSFKFYLTCHLLPVTFPCYHLFLLSTQLDVMPLSYKQRKAILMLISKQNNHMRSFWKMQRIAAPDLLY